jgi:RecG-like helicase
LLLELSAPIAMDPRGPLTQLRGVGPQAAQTLAKLGLNSPLDLLLHLPFRYQDRSKVSAIAHIQAGTEALIVGEVICHSSLVWTPTQFGSGRT